MTVGADRPSPRGGSCKTTEQMNGIIVALGGAKHRSECAMSRRLTLGAAIASPRSSGGPAEGGRETNVRLTTKTTIFPLIQLESASCALFIFPINRKNGKESDFAFLVEWEIFITIYFRLYSRCGAPIEF